MNGSKDSGCGNDVTRPISVREPHDDQIQSLALRCCLRKPAQRRQPLPGQNFQRLSALLCIRKCWISEDTGRSISGIARISCQAPWLVAGIVFRLSIPIIDHGPIHVNQLGLEVEVNRCFHFPSVPSGQLCPEFIHFRRFEVVP